MSTHEMRSEDEVKMQIDDGGDRNAAENVFFLEESFLRHYYPIAQLPPEHREELLAAAARIAADPVKRSAARAFHRQYLGDDPAVLRSFPARIPEFGDDTPIFYLLLLMALIPGYEERAAREKFPLRYAHAAASRIGTLPERYAKAHQGKFGTEPISLPFMLHFLYREAFRIGRFDFMLEQAGKNLPIVYESEGRFRLFCQDGWELNSDGERSAPGGAVARHAFFREENGFAEGIPIDPATGTAEERSIRIPLRGQTKLIEPGEWLLHFHIPAGGGMKPELCRESFREAIRFFREHYPDRPVRRIYTVSWIGNPLWAERLPESNLARLIRASLLFPYIATPDAGVFFVFGRNDSDYDAFPRNTALERLFIECLKTGSGLRSVGMLIPPALFL